MVKKGAQMLQARVDETVHDDTWNIVELESRRQLRRTVQALIDMTNSPLVTTSDIQQQISAQTAVYETLFGRQLVRALRSDDEQHRQSAIWLLTLLDDEATIPLLQQMSQNQQFSRATRLAAAFALAGMNATREVAADRYYSQIGA